MESTDLRKELISYLSDFISEKRRAKFDEVLNYRTKHITIVLEDIYQPHNASAVLRSCDIFGIQDIHIIENRNKYTINRDVALGSARWLNLYKYKEEENNSLSCINQLKEKGYRIIATTPHKNDCTIEKLPIDKPLALVFGTELTGISDDVKNNADEFVIIPMFGFTESFNISVTAALCLNAIITKLHQADFNWHLNDKEKEECLLKWLKSSIKKADLIEREFFKRLKS